MNRPSLAESAAFFSAYHAAIDSAVASGISVVDSRGRVIHANPALCRMIGAEGQELLGEVAPLSYWAPESLDDCNRAFRLALDGRFPAEGIELVFARRDGRRFPVLVHVSPLIHRARTIGWLANVVDLSPIRDRDRQLQDSRRRFQDLAGRMEEVFYVHDVLTHSMTYVSPSFEKVWGVPVGRIMANPATYLDAIAPESRAEVNEAFKRQLRGEATRTQYRVLRPDGTSVWIRDKSYPVCDELGKVVRIVGIAADVSDLMHAQLSLERQEALVQQAQEIAQLGTWILMDGATASWSDETYRLLGYTKGEITPSPQMFRARIHPDDLPRMRSEILAGPERLYTSFRVLWPSGEIRTLVAHSLTRKNQETGSLYTVGTLQDITEARAAEARASQEKRLEALGKLTGGLAHDFNNLLGIIIGGLDELAWAVKDAPGAESTIQQLQSAAMRGAELTRALLSMARRRPLEVQAVDLNARIRELEPLLRHSAGVKAGVDFMLRDDPLVAHVEIASFDSALVNLLVNARDAMPAGGLIRVSTRKCHVPQSSDFRESLPKPGDYVLLEVEDSGRGMNPEVAEKAFDPFFTTKPEGAGTGLGLAMVHSFMTQLGGTALLESAPGRGTRISLYFPLPAGASATVAVAAEPEPATPRPPEKSLRILVVDDEPALRHMTRRTLQRLGHRVDAAGSSAEAQALLEQGTYDVLFSDIVMPNGDGLSLAQIVARRWPDTAIVLTTGFSAGAEQMQVRWRIVEKPYRSSELAAVFDEVLAQRARTGTPS
jgi:PAS domain S-box-containing protein